MNRLITALLLVAGTTFAADVIINPTTDPATIEASDLSDVADLSGAAADDVLTYNGALWTNAAAGGASSPTNAVVSAILNGATLSSGVTQFTFASSNADTAGGVYDAASDTFLLGTVSTNAIWGFAFTIRAQDMTNNERWTLQYNSNVDVAILNTGTSGPSLDGITASDSDYHSVSGTGLIRTKSASSAIGVGVSLLGTGVKFDSGFFSAWLIQDLEE